MSRKFTVAKTNKMIQEDALLLDMQTCEVINRVSSTVDLESLGVLSDLEKNSSGTQGMSRLTFHKI